MCRHYQLSGMQDMVERLQYPTNKEVVYDIPFLYKLGQDQILRWCVLEDETTDILAKCHKTPYKGHFDGQKTVAKVLQSGYFWTTLFQDARNFVVKCD